MTKKLTRGQAIRLHRKLWRWLSEHPLAYKHQWPGWEDNGGEHSYNTQARCFLCELTKYEIHKCKACPVVWPGAHGTCNPLFCNWENAGPESLRKKLALQISKLPAKKLTRKKK